MSQIPVDNDDALATRIRGILHDATCAQDGPPGLIYAALDRSGRILVHEAAGVRELGKETPMTLDAVFGINSCTKISTTIAVLQLVERGLLELDEPIDKVLPELADVKILSKDGTLIPTNGIDITMRMLLTHTAGFGYSFDNEAKRKYLEEHVGVNEVSGLKKGVLQPVVAFEPGTAFLYGGSTDWAGEAVARLTGQTLGAYMKENIFDPLEAYDIAFALTDDQRSRLVPMHLRSAVTGKLTVAPHQNYILWPTLDPSYTNGEPEPYHAGSLGMLATSTSLLRVLAPLVRGGVGLNGARVLSERTIEALLQERLEEKGDSYTCKRSLAGMWPENGLGERAERGEENVPGRGFGFAGGVSLTPMLTGRNTGAVFWAGAANCFWHADPSRGVLALFMCQLMPMLDPAVMRALRRCETALYAALM